jgi:hypothetical protein
LNTHGLWKLPHIGKGSIATTFLCRPWAHSGTVEIIKIATISSRFIDFTKREPF